MEGTWAWKPEDEDFSFFLRNILGWLQTQPKLFIFLFMAVLGLGHCTGFAPIAASGAYSIAVVPRLLFAVASLAAEHALQAVSARASAVAASKL